MTWISAGGLRPLSAARHQCPLWSHPSADLHGDTVHRAEVGAEERERIQDQRGEEHDARVLDARLLLNCLKGCLVEIEVWSLKVDLDDLGEGSAKEI